MQRMHTASGSLTDRRWTGLACLLRCSSLLSSGCARVLGWLRGEEGEEEARLRTARREIATPDRHTTKSEPSRARSR
jgi:hypothetical protein